MVVRRLEGDETHEADLLWLQCFERGLKSSLDGLSKWREGLEPRIVRFGLWDEAGMQATLQMYGKRLQFESGVVIPAAYISSIACAPARRGRGYGSACLKHALEHMRDAGQIVTTLSPFEYAYYRELGWEWIRIIRGYRVPSRMLRVVPETEDVRLANPQDRPGIEEAYRRFSARYRGMAVRDEVEWDLVLDGSKSYVSYVYVYESDGGIDGYLVMRGGGSEETFLPEFISLTPQAQRALLGLLRRLHNQAKTFVWDAPEDDGLWSQFMHRDMHTGIGPGLQGRVVDVEAALTALKPALSGDFVIDIQDPFASWNAGTWQVAFADGVVTVASTKRDAEIQVDIQAFTQAFFGVLPVTALRGRDRMAVIREPAFQALRGLLDGPPMWYNGPI
ncbi:MAG TPA: GNAT family N-acetyltransferase [Fimbriimonas sp.]|nr:GNAT family N-acetyltransferase [Fimbriimonas sp.]